MPIVVPAQCLHLCRRASMLQKAFPRIVNLRRHMASSVSSNEEDVIISKVNDKAIFTLNRPKVLNALSLSMIRKMTASLKEWMSDHSVKFVIIKGAGGKSFCCGGDLREIVDAGKALNQFSRDYFFEEYSLDYLTGSFGAPWIALIDGITMGAGCGLSVHGTYRIATERTLFAMPETAIGLFPDVGGGHFLPRLPGKIGIYLALTGARLRGRDVQKVGIATHFVESSEIPSLERDLMSLNSPKPDEIEAVIKSYHEKCSLDRDKPHVLEQVFEKINFTFSGQTLEEIFENLRSEGSDWSIAQLDTMNKMSPTSMKVTLRQMQEGATLSLAEDLKMEYRLVQRFIRGKDFYEGVRAVVIDKDQKPLWNPTRIEDVTNEQVDSYFSPLPQGERELVL